MTATSAGVQVSAIDGREDLAFDDAVTLLREAVPAPCTGLAPYHAAGFAAFLRTAVTPPEPLRTVFLRSVRVGARVQAVADWRLAGKCLFLNGIAVTAAERGRGHGGRLLDDGHKLAGRLACAELALDVSIDNAPARSLYERRGFIGSGYAEWVGTTADPNYRDLPVRLLDWPSFEAHHAAYGFGDLHVASEFGNATVRVVGRALRVPADDSGPILAAALAGAVRHTRCFAVRSPGSGSPTGDVFARFLRMTCPVDAQVSDGCRPTRGDGGRWRE